MKVSQLNPEARTVVFNFSRMEDTLAYMREFMFNEPHGMVTGHIRCNRNGEPIRRIVVVTKTIPTLSGDRRVEQPSNANTGR